MNFRYNNNNHTNQLLWAKIRKNHQLEDLPLFFSIFNIWHYTLNKTIIISLSLLIGEMFFCRYAVFFITLQQNKLFLWHSADSFRGGYGLGA